MAGFAPISAIRRFAMHLSTWSTQVAGMAWISMTRHPVFAMQDTERYRSGRDRALNDNLRPQFRQPPPVRELCRRRYPSGLMAFDQPWRTRSGRPWALDGPRSV